MEPKRRVILHGDVYFYNSLRRYCSPSRTFQRDKSNVDFPSGEERKREIEGSGGRQVSATNFPLIYDRHIGSTWCSPVCVPHRMSPEIVTGVKHILENTGQYPPITIFIASSTSLPEYLEKGSSCSRNALDNSPPIHISVRSNFHDRQSLMRGFNGH